VETALSSKGNYSFIKRKILVRYSRFAIGIDLGGTRTGSALVNSTTGDVIEKALGIL
jgi:hypothetical protein